MAWLRRGVFALGALSLVGLVVAVTLGGYRFATKYLGEATASAATPAPKQKLKPVPFGPKQFKLRSVKGNESRLILDDETTARLERNAERRTEVWQRAHTRCEKYAQSPAPSGYQGFEWADALATLTLCWKATGDARYADVAVGYFDALLNDRFRVGDKKGGAGVVRHDSGYGIRTFGAYSALGYDWLRGAPAMTPELKRLAVDRLTAWLSWYEQHGYLNDEPIANYYIGYLTTLALAGLATAGEHSVGVEWLEKARKELSHRALPAFKEHLAGGDWPEGWQYGEYVLAELALVSRAFETAAGVRLTGKLPWLGQTVRHHVHALLPSGGSVYDGGTWGEHPAKPSALGMYAVAFALDGVRPKHAARARWLASEALPPLLRQGAWIALLGDYPGAKKSDPRRGERPSFHLEGTGLSFMRSDWSKDAVWVSFKAGPRLTPDHQHKDEGHFELWRGGDGLLVDGGDSEGGATINHNTLLIDDGGRHMTYPPNQGVWGHSVRTTAFGDDGEVAVTSGEIGEAYAPACVREGCTQRSVERATRTLVFVRPGLVVMRDDVKVESEEDRVTWAAHLTVAPQINGRRAFARIGRSRIGVQTLAPSRAKVVSLKEPTASGDGPHRLNQPWGPMWRLEVRSPEGSTKREFLHWMVATGAKARDELARHVRGKGHLDGAVGRAFGRTTAVVFAPSDAKRGELALPAGTERIVVAGLTPGARYRLSVRKDGGSCRLKIQRAQGGRSSGSGGFVRAKGCKE